MFVPTSLKFESSSSSSGSTQLCRQFKFCEIQLATQNFDESLVVGRGGFGKVYKGTITNGPNFLTVAIKRQESTSNQGEQEFWAEVSMLSSLRHCHLVSLIGYCNDGKEMIIVYEYMSRGTLEDHLHKGQTKLSWVRRLKICLGAARGLDYLHTGTGIKQGVVHRDVKSSNILLHDSWEAKISDFGLSKICRRNQHTTYVNSGVKGTFGYLDPDYFYTGKLTRKSDVYAFGVVLFESLCGKRAVDRSIDEDQWCLAVWAQDSIKKGGLKQIVDTNIRRVISPKSLKVFAQLATRCLHKDPKQRPTMAEVVASLESIMALQEKASKTSQQPTGMQFLAERELMEIFPSNDENSRGQTQTLCRFDYDTIKFATEDFNEANRIHLFLYKGKLQNEQGILVSNRRSNTSYEIFMNEASMLVKLNHTNLGKLRGYCIRETRLFLVYDDFGVHATLNHFLFDPECTLFKWDKRYKIILGVARALLYLHRDAPIQIVHGDVRPNNILLDENLNPVLLDFLNTRYIDFNKIEDYYHWTQLFPQGDYVPPEISWENLSTKGDVYSFGVLVLETITTHSLPYNISLLGYVQENWLKGTLAFIIDPRIEVDSSSITKFFEIGLLCVQIDAEERPTMEEVVSMLLDSPLLTLLVEKMRARITRERFDFIQVSFDDHTDSTSDEEFTLF